MAFVGDLVTVFLGTATLLLLSLYTFLNFRGKLPEKPTSIDSFLFHAGKRRYSLAGTIGYAFSITYFGATIIYGHLYGLWFVAGLLVTTALSVHLVHRALDRANVVGLPANDRPRNVLLDLIEKKLGPRNLQHVATLYLVIYFALLAEELAVSRVMLEAIFPSHPVVTAILLATICIVIVTYIRWGGFQAVLIADYEQLKLLAPFVFALVFLIVRHHTATYDFDVLRIRATFGGGAIVIGLIFGVTWIITSVDFYSRLNFPLRPPVAQQRKGFVTVVMALTAAVFSVGALYGLSMPAGAWKVHRPAEFTEAIVRWSLQGGSRAAAIVMFASVFCMIFTTLNTLIITLLQVGRYRSSQFPRLDHIHRIVLSAVLASCALWPNSVSVIGVFIGSLLMLPALAVFASLSDRIRTWLPRNFAFVWPALAASIVGIVLVYRIAIEYDRMHWAGGIVAVSAVVFATVAKLIERKAT